MFPCLTHSNSCCSSNSVKGTVVKQILILNKNIVHLIDDMFWYMGFKTESQAEKVILIIHFITIIPLITIITLIRIICIQLIARYVKILDLQITCGRTKGLLLPKSWWLGQSVSSCHARLLAFLHQSGLPGQHSPCCRPTRGAGHVGASRLSQLCFPLLLTLI